MLLRRDYVLLHSLGEDIRALGCPERWVDVIINTVPVTPKVKKNRLAGKTFFSGKRVVINGKVIHSGWVHPDERETVLAAIENNKHVFGAYLFFALWLEIQPTVIDWLIRIGFFKTI